MKRFLYIRYIKRVENQPFTNQLNIYYYDTY